MLTFPQRRSGNLFINKVSFIMNRACISFTRGQTPSRLIKAINPIAALCPPVFWNCFWGFVFVLYSTGCSRQSGASVCKPQTLKTDQTACVCQLELAVKKCWFHRQPFSNEKCIFNLVSTMKTLRNYVSWHPLMRPSVVPLEQTCCCKSLLSWEPCS